MGGHPCSMADGRCLRCGRQGLTAGCPVCPPPVRVVGKVTAPSTTFINLTPEELEVIKKMPLCPHGRRVGLHPCPWCAGINGVLR